MSKKNTRELVNVLGKTHISDFDSYVKSNKDSMLDEEAAFSVYVKDLLSEKGITQQKVFIEADIPERYGYKLLSGEKHTKQRDVILRICYAAGFSLEETQSALRKYRMPELYAKMARDAFLMMVFEQRPGNILEVNGLLKKNNFEPLRTSGVQE